MTSQLVQLSALVGFLLPLVVSLVKQSGWSVKVQSVVSAVAVGIASLITVWADTGFTWDNWAASLITVFLVSKTSYEHFWKPTGVSPKLDKVSTS